MGFDAIWISPVNDNYDNGYHGYWYRNMYDVNKNFGTSQDLKNLVTACHNKGVWVMVDVVANHVYNNINIRWEIQIRIIHKIIHLIHHLIIMIIVS